MKKNLLILLLLYNCTLFAIDRTVDVANFSFTPNNFTANVGDVIIFKWVSGFHTTTSTSVPAGANPWDADLNGTGQTFSYTVAIPGTYNFQCSVHGAAMSGTFTAGGTAPVTLAFMQISARNTVPVVQWQTASEQNISDFIIERSYNGRNYVEAGHVQAAGNSSIAVNYSFVDEFFKKDERFIYYRLRMVGNDHEYKFSDINLFRNDLSSANNKLLGVFPNPIAGDEHLMVEFESETAGSGVCTFVNLAGQVIQKTEFAFNEGFNHTHMPLEHLKPGSYMVHFKCGDVDHAKKILVTK